MTHEFLIDIFKSAVDAVDPYNLILRKLNIKNGILKLFDENESFELDLNNFDKIIVIGIGKASAKMALGVENVFKGYDFEGLVVTKYGHTEKLTKFEVLQAGHPVPDENSIRGAEKIINLLKNVNDKTFVLTLVSGGGSALVSAPREGFTLADKQDITGKLLERGADIGEINCVRKHLSRMKGGGYLKLLKDSFSLNLILSDVIGDRLDTIASGLTYFDSTTFHDALKICVKYNIEGKVKEYFKKGALGGAEETLKEKDIKSSRFKNVIIGSNYHALLGAKKKAKQLGLSPLILTDELFGEAREVAKVLLSFARGFKKYHKGYDCLISGGETTVTIKGSGKGGRNQEMALAFLSELTKNDEGICFLSAGTDGNDGPTDAAGAMASYEILKRAYEVGLNPDDFLQNNDSYRFFEQVKALVKTGPTNTNVCDVQIVLLNSVT
jgi:hydroxypyruvate reductase